MRGKKGDSNQLAGYCSLTDVSGTSPGGTAQTAAACLTRGFWEVKSLTLPPFFFFDKKLKKKKKELFTWSVGTVRGSRSGGHYVLQGGFQSSGLPPG